MVLNFQLDTYTYPLLGDFSKIIRDTMMQIAQARANSKIRLIASKTTRTEGPSQLIGQLCSCQSCIILYSRPSLED